MSEAVDVASELESDGLLTLEPSAEDVVTAMRRMSGYLDISTDDFRTLYRLAHEETIERVLRPINAAGLMIPNLQPLRPEMLLEEAARLLAAQCRKSLPVVDAEERVVGILTESDFLRCLGAASFIGLLLGWVEEPAAFVCRCRNLTVGENMSSPALCIQEGAHADQMLRAFRRHHGRSMPVIDASGRLRGLLLRKDMLHACRALRA